MVVKKGMAIKVNKLQKQQFDFGIVSYHFLAVLNCFPERLQYTGEKKYDQQKECHTTWQPRIRCH